MLRPRDELEVPLDRQELRVLPSSSSSRARWSLRHLPRLAVDGDLHRTPPAGGEELERIRQHVAQRHEEPRSVGAVDDAVIVRERQRQHQPLDDLAVDELQLRSPPRDMPRMQTSG